MKRYRTRWAMICPFFIICVIAGSVLCGGCRQLGGQNQKQDLRVLFLGNSHTTRIPELVEKVFEADGNFNVTTKAIRGPFLDAIAARGIAQAELESGFWDVIVLQGQKISMSGRFNYSTAEAKELSRVANENNVKVILYSEWGRRGVAGETERIQKVYESIGEEYDDILAPVGAAWEASLEQRSDLALHAADGNHANPQGAFLTAMTLYVAISGKDCAELPTANVEGISADLQSYFRAIVSRVAADLVVERKANE